MLLSGVFSSAFRTAVVAGSFLSPLSAVCAESNLQALGPAWFKNCSTIPNDQDMWVLDCSRRYTESGQYLVERLHKNEQKRSSGVGSYSSIERELHLYRK